MDNGNTIITEYYEDSENGKNGIKSKIIKDADGNIISSTEYDNDGFIIEHENDQDNNSQQLENNSVQDNPQSDSNPSWFGRWFF